MKQIYHHYTKWEDYQNGMYNEEKEGRQERVKKAIEILSDSNICYKAMKMVIENWNFACDQNLSNDMYSHRSFLGQSACSIYANVHEDETREAWGKLTDLQRKRANKIADMVYLEWLNRNEDNLQISFFGEV